MSCCTFRTAALIDLGAIKHNLRAVKMRCQRGVWAVVKANAYGHGATQVASAVEGQVKGFAVATAEEGAQLRLNGIRAPVLILGDVPTDSMETLIDCNLIPTLFCIENGRALQTAAKKRGVTLGVHAAIDTGMGRIGFAPTQQGIDALCAILRQGGLRLDGVFTHFATADEPDSLLYPLQQTRFRTALELLRRQGFQPPVIHAGNSAAALVGGAYEGCVRTGLALYGVSPIKQNKCKIGILPAMQWETKIVQIKEIAAGDNVGYGGVFTAPEPMRVATLSVGYADGYPRALSGRGWTLVGGEIAPVLGRVCMDMMMVDVTHCPSAKIGDAAVLIGRQGERRIAAADLADAAGTVAYELLAGVASRVKRIYHNGEDRR